MSYYKQKLSRLLNKTSQYIFIVSSIKLILGEKPTKKLDILNLEI